MAQFRTKARAVDLLGKGQIADLPTAISELWKNGYDAYGDNLQAFLYMAGFQGHSEPIFALTDDGKGMSREDILEKWFVLGTDSKSRYDLDKKGEETLGKEPRVKMGEKGIGRLAVAYLGPQMLMLTKKPKHPVEAVFFDWRILENYDLFLSDVNIPLKSIDTINSFQSVFNQLKKEFLLNFPEPPKNKSNWSDPWRDQLELKKSIISDCNGQSVPQFIVDDIVSDFFNSPTKSHGTKFIVFKPDSQIIELKDFIKIDDGKDTVSESYTISTLVGLFNSFKTENFAQKTNFWIYEKSDTGKYDLLASKSFFTPTDFEECDHLIKGTFNEYGEFKGKVRIYRETVDHSFKPIKKRALTNYGAFKIKLGYVQYEEKSTLLNAEKKRAFEEKLRFFSGLFIYRDGFRVLPYGRVDTDFLEFEDRRSKGAGTYFFSKRRMFGYIEITREANKKLIDKSSREGFVNNAAYRDFKVDLIAFFKDLAKKYFATDAQSDIWSSQQEEIGRLAFAERQEREREKEARKEFARKLKDLPAALEELEKKYERLLSQLEVKKDQSQIVYEEIRQILSQIEECKVQAANLRIIKPTRFKPTDLQKKNYHNYGKSYQSLIKRFEESNSILEKVRAKLKVQELFREFEAQNELYKNKLSDQFSEFNVRLENIFQRVNNEFADEKERFIADFLQKGKSIIPSNNDARQIARSMKLLETIFKESQERIANRVNPFFEHLEQINFEVNEDDLVGYYKMQFEEMKEEWNKTYELAQLGIAVEIIDHQFNTLYSQLADSIKSLKNQIQPNKDAERRYKNLDSAFEHLQDNYKLLQPLYRTTGRIRKDVIGKDLKEYVEDFFKARLQENDIKFSITNAGQKWKVFSYESIFKPVLINIVNNAIYWLQPSDNREIRMDEKDGKLLVMNSGEPIEDYMLQDIFKLFYSNRPQGRGIGLYLAKQSLNGIGYEIEATNDSRYNLLKGACFIIYKKDN